MTEIFRIVLNMSITAAYICIFVMLIRLFLKKLPAKFSYFLWIIPFIRMICPFSVETTFSLFNLIKPKAESYISQSVEYDQSPVIDTGFPLPSAPENITVPLPEAVPENSANPVQIMLFAGTIIWLAGIVGIAVYTAVCIIWLRKRLSNARPLQDNVMICSDIETPFVFGIIKPKIYLPEDISVEDMPFILAHEQAHIHRKDHIIKPLAFAALTVHWFNPILWLSFKLMERDMELSCDESAVESFSEDVRKDYASALLNISMKQNHLSGGQVISFGENSVKSRIKGVLNWKKPTVIAVCMAVLLIIIAAAVLLTDGKSKNVTKDNPANDVHITDSNFETAPHDSPSTNVPIIESKPETIIQDSPTTDLPITDSNTEKETVDAKMSVSAEYDKQSNKLTITSESIDGTSVMTGNPYTIERLENGEYVPVFPVQPVPDNFVPNVFTAESIYLGDKWQERQFTRSYTISHTVLYNGTYRISKTYRVENDETDQTAYCTLEITDGMLSPENAAAAAEKLLTAEQKAEVLDISSPEITPMCFYDFSDSEKTQNQLCYRVTYKTNSADITLFISAFDGSPCLTAE